MMQQQTHRRTEGEGPVLLQINLPLKLAPADMKPCKQAFIDVGFKFGGPAIKNPGFIEVEQTPPDWSFRRSIDPQCTDVLDAQGHRQAIICNGKYPMMQMVPPNQISIGDFTIEVHSKTAAVVSTDNLSAFDFNPRRI